MACIVRGLLTCSVVGAKVRCFELQHARKLPIVGSLASWSHCGCAGPDADMACFGEAYSCYSCLFMIAGVVVAGSEPGLCDYDRDASLSQALFCLETLGPLSTSCKTKI